MRCFHAVSPTGRLIGSLTGLLAGLALVATPAVADRDSALAAFDRGDLAAARAELRAEEGHAAFYLALASEGEDRAAALARAGTLAAGGGGWLEPALAAIAAMDGERFDEAAAALRAATAAAPSDPRLWKLLGDMLERGNKPRDALQAYERAVGLAPAYSAALLGVGDLRLAAGEFGPAFNAFNHAVGEDGQPVAGLLGKAAASLYLGDRQGAVEDLDRAAQIAEPGPDRGRALMGTLYVRTLERRLPVGLDRAEQAIAMWTDLGRADMAAAAANAAGRVLLETGDPSAAETWYERAAQIIASSSLPVEERADLEGPRAPRQGALRGGAARAHARQRSRHSGAAGDGRGPRQCRPLCVDRAVLDGLSALSGSATTPPRSTRCWPPTRIASTSST